MPQIKFLKVQRYDKIPRGMTPSSELVMVRVTFNFVSHNKIPEEISSIKKKLVCGFRDFRAWPGVPPAMVGACAEEVERKGEETRVPGAS